MNPPELGEQRSWSDPTIAAEGMIGQALSACTDQTGSASQDALLELLRRGDPPTWSQCQYALAQRVAEYLETCADDVKAVYIYDSDWTPEERRWDGVNVAPGAGSAPLIHLIVWAQPKTAALRALIDILNRALALRLGRTIGALAMTQLLDAQVIDDQDVSRRSGYAALLTSSRYRAAQVWRRQAEA